VFDDFGIAASPTTGLGSIIHSDDRFDPNGPNTRGCDATTSNKTGTACGRANAAHSRDYVLELVRVLELA